MRTQEEELVREYETQVAGLQAARDSLNNDLIEIRDTIEPKIKELESKYLKTEEENIQLRATIDEYIQIKEVWELELGKKNQSFDDLKQRYDDLQFRFSELVNLKEKLRTDWEQSERDLREKINYITELEENYEKIYNELKIKENMRRPSAVERELTAVFEQKFREVVTESERRISEMEEIIEGRRHLIYSDLDLESKIDEAEKRTNKKWEEKVANISMEIERLRFKVV